MSQHATFCLCRRRRHGGFPIVVVGSLRRMPTVLSVIAEFTCMVICSCLLVRIIALRRTLIAFGRADACEMIYVCN